MSAQSERGWLLTEWPWAVWSEAQGAPPCGLTAGMSYRLTWLAYKPGPGTALSVALWRSYAEAPSPRLCPTRWNCQSYPLRYLTVRGTVYSSWRGGDVRRWPSVSPPLSAAACETPLMYKACAALHQSCTLRRRTLCRLEIGRLRVTHVVTLTKIFHVQSGADSKDGRNSLSFFYFE